MKCPKCDYLGYESGDRCRNCGYDFSLAAEAFPENGPVRGDGSAGRAPADSSPPAPPDFRIRRGRHGGLRPLAPSELDRPLASEPDSGPIDLPLFDVPAGGIPRPTPPPRPLAVRKTTPPTPRARPRVERPRPVELDLDLETEVASPVQADAVPLAAPAAAEIGEPAGTSRRVAAALIDGALVLAVDAVVLYFTLRLAGLPAGEIGVLPRVPLLAFFLLLNGGYLVLFTGTVGQTLGKMATGITVVADDRPRMDLARGSIRGLACLATLFTLGLGFVPALLGDRRALHDRLAGTRVRRLAS